MDTAKAAPSASHMDTCTRQQKLLPPTLLRQTLKRRPLGSK